MWPWPQRKQRLRQIPGSKCMFEYLQDDSATTVQRMLLATVSCQEQKHVQM